ncbi:MAG: hypothetical protein RR957_01330, partial [Oscillospiraceae bacterium]
MQRRFISILVVITLCLNLIIVQATSYVQDGSVVQVGPRAKLLDSADENLFKIEGSDQTFVMLDSTSNEGFLVAAYDDYGRHNGVNLVDWINRDFRINGNGEKKLPQSMTANLNYNKQWSDGAKHGMYLVDESIRGVYGDKLGMVDNTGHGRNGVWSFYSAAENSNDTEFYKKTEPEDANGGISVKGGKNIAWDINEIVTVSPGTQNLGKSVIGFTAPKDGIYGLNLTLSGASGTDTDKIRITSCPKDYVYDENLEKTILLSALAGDKIESLNCNLKAGDKIYVHLPNSDNRYNIKYSITQGVNTYDMAKFFDKGENKIWSGDVVNGVRKAYDLNASTAGQILDANENDELLIRPVFCLNSKFFKDNRLDLLNTGKNVLYHLRKNFTIDQLGIYNNYENNSIFHVSEGFLFDEIPLTSNGNPLTTLNGVNHVEGGVNVQNNTADDKTVAYYIALYNENALVDIVSKEAVIPAYNIQTINLDMKIERDVAGLTLKTFIWDGIQTMQPLTEIKATLNKIVRISDASINNTSDFEFYKKAKKEVNVGNYVPLTLNGSSNVTVNSQPTNAWWSKGNVNNEINIRTVADKEVGDGKAGLVIGWTVPYNGNWKISLSIKNVGTDVNGGDGGSVKLTYLPAGRTSDDMPIAVMGVPTSTKNAVYFDSVNTINATGGDKIFFTTDAGVDGYGDQWKVKYQIEETNENGRKILDVGDLNGVAQVDKTGDFKGPSTDGNLVWIGVDGTFGDTVAMQESILYIKKYIPNIGVIFLDGFPERKANMKFYEENGIPTLTQTYGQEYVNFFDATKAWEKEWHGNVLGPGAGYELAGTGHASAMPHPATREAFGRVIKSATEHGFSGFGFPDCVWMWGARGVTGYNEKTLQAFTEDVTKRDRGLRVRLDGVNVTTMNFWDYYSYYAGNDVLNPADIGFASWNDYHPLTVEEWRGMTSAEAIPRLGLFDILCHYEWLKMVQFSADTAQENGGVCQIMPNPEYHPNGVDYLFLNAIENVDMTSEEFFGDTSYLDGAYYRYPYITGFGKGDNVSVGGVMEAGGGGNAGAYYTPEIAYATAYELGASGLEHLETDFWAQSPLDDLKKNENLQRRDTQIMSYGMGFNDSKKDALSKPKGDFVCVSNRRIFRPWSPGNAWEPWTLNLKKAGEVDFVLGKMGYNFDGISQEGLEKMELP